MTSDTTDFLLVGAGIIGTTLALELKRRFPDASIQVIEKEKGPAIHASGRNSGVIHAGFYYTADSLKAKFCREGNSRLREYCKEKRLPINQCGKLVVAKNEQDLEQLDELKRRGEANGVNLETLTARQAKEIEPRAITHERALFSPTTATADPVKVTCSLESDAKALGVKFCYEEAYLSKSEETIRTSKSTISAGYVINCAGLHADRVAHDFGHGTHYRILPFKGIYLYSSEQPGSLRTNIYPVPNLRNPFLGVHFTVAVDGRVKIGPTAIPCFWREQYRGLDGFNLKDVIEIVGLEAKLFTGNVFGFRSLALEEIKKYWRPYLVGQAAQLATGVSRSQFLDWGKPGIRAQLLDIRSMKLVMDFCLEGDNSSFHVLNAVSPAWTSSMPFAAHVADRISACLDGKEQQSFP